MVEDVARKTEQGTTEDQELSLLKLQLEILTRFKDAEEFPLQQKQLAMIERMCQTLKETDDWASRPDSTKDIVEAILEKL